jgi:hypothetical protein
MRISVYHYAVSTLVVESVTGMDVFTLNSMMYHYSLYLYTKNDSKRRTLFTKHISRLPIKVIQFTITVTIDRFNFY